ncbi:glycosyltransferase family 2 protein [Candidatus Bathyarchaeota archaeon]|nr:glycosyltransferase family 2 protein [Candidatus Bathyarchaeota archaeon]
MKEYLGLRVAKALNYALKKVKVEDYDYILRVDADIKLPPDFIEKNLEIDAEIVGKAGYAMLIKTKSFLKIFNGRFPEVPAEDSFLNLSLMSRKRKVEDWRTPPILLKQSRKKHSWRYYFHRGEAMYKLGYEPIHVAERARTYGLMNAFTVLGYFISVIKRKEKYEISRWVFKTQLKRLTLFLHST